jgi:hypothetical protein
MTRHGRNSESQVDSGDDAIVELTRVAFLGEAVAIKQDLERIGIHAAVFESDAGGWAPHFGIGPGTRVMVRAQDLLRARQMLSADGGQLPVEEPAKSSPTFEKHVRRHTDS